MRKILKYIEVFFITLLILFSLLVITAKLIPRSAISENIKKSTYDFNTKREIEEVVRKRDYTYKHPYADAMLLNIIYCIDSSNATKSVMEAKYFVEYENDPTYIQYNFDEMIDNQIEGNTEYMRYWHGSMIFIRPLLMFFSLGQIYTINKIIFWILIVTLLALLIKKKHIALLVTFIIGLIMCYSHVIPTCLEYTWTFDIMLITSIIAILIEKDQKKLDVLFFITGMVTCYFDFLTTELVSIMVPLIFVLGIRYKENRITNIRDTAKLVIKEIALWLIAFIGMWVSKWILASAILDINAIEYVKEHIKLRTTGEIIGISKQKLPFEAMAKNLFTLYPINIQKRIRKLMMIPIDIVVFEAIFVKKKKIKEAWISLIFLFIAITPYIRYLVLANHSYRHYFFTFRSQIITIMALLLAIIYSMNMEMFKLRKRTKEKDMK